MMTNCRLALVIGGTSVLSLAAGSALGYLFAQKKLELEYRELTEREIAEAKKFYSVLYKKDSFNTPQSTVERLLPVEAEALKALQSYQGEDSTMSDDRDFVPQKSQWFAENFEDKDKTDEIEIVQNIFEQAKPDSLDFNYEEESKHRTAETPYIISQDEFMLNEMGYAQSTLTYFVGDDVLVDERDQPIENSDQLVGDDNLLKFGHGSGDKNIVYVRNDRLSQEFEIAKSMGKYTVEVLGFIDDTESRPRVRSGRGDDG